MDVTIIVVLVSLLPKGHSFTNILPQFPDTTKEGLPEKSLGGQRRITIESNVGLKIPGEELEIRSIRTVQSQ
jgi:hypothetical protein